MLVEEAEVDVNARQQQGSTALMSVAQHGDRAMVDYLIEHGADPTLKSDTGDDAAAYAINAGHADLADHLQTLVAERSP